MALHLHKMPRVKAVERRWNYVSPDAYQAEVVWLLQWEEEKKGPRKRVEMVAEKASSACAVS